MTTNASFITPLIEDIKNFSATEQSFKSESDFVQSLIDSLSQKNRYQFESYKLISNSVFFMLCLLQENYVVNGEYDFRKLSHEILVDGKILDRMSPQTEELLVAMYVDVDDRDSIKGRTMSENSKRVFDFLGEISRKYNAEGTIESLAYFIESKILIEQIIKEIRLLPFTNEDQEKMFIEKKVKQEFNFDILINRLKEARKLFVEADREATRKAKKKIAKFSQMLKSLENEDASLVTDIDDDLFQSMSEESQLRYLEFIISNRIKKFRQLKESNVELLQSTKTDYVDQILLSYKVCGSSLSEQAKALLMQVERTKTIACLDIFKYYKLSLIELLNSGLAEVIFYSDSAANTVADIFVLSDKKIIDIDFIKRYLGIMIKEGTYDGDKIMPFYNRLMENINIFRGFNPKFFENKFYNPEMLLDVPEELKKQLALLKKYRYGISITNCQFLTSPRVFDLLDYFIENNYDIRILNNVDILRVPINFVIKRLEVMKAIETNMTEEMIISCFNRVQYLPSDTELDVYIVNDGTRFINPDCKGVLDDNTLNIIDSEILRIDVLDKFNRKYQSSNLSAYDINGIIVSRHRVLRYLTVLIKEYGIDNIGELVFNAIIYGKFLNEDEINVIKKSLASINLGTRTKTIL